MEETSLLWTYNESVDELNEKLMCTIRELQQVKMKSVEETSRTQEYVNQLLQLIEMVCKERDEARFQLQILLNKFMPLSTTDEDHVFPPPVSNNSSTGDSIFDVISSSPDYSNVNVGDSRNIELVNQSFITIPNGMPEIDEESLLIDKIAKGKKLPEKGMFLKAVLDAGPLLQNLLVAGSLPRWRNPPRLETSFQIPPVPVKVCDVMEAKSVKIAPELVPVVGSRPSAEMSCFSGFLSNSVGNFGNGGYGSCLGSNKVIGNGVNGDSYVQVGKRQRLY